MKHTLTAVLCVFALFAAFCSAAAQETLKQVIILNEGKFGGPVIIGSYNPATRIYSNFDTINVKFASDVIVDNKSIYVAADTLLIRYDIETKQRISERTVKGIRELTIWHDQLLVTRGDFVATLPSYFQAYDKNTLNMIYELPNLSTHAAEVKVLNDIAYVAVNGFGTVGKLAMIDLKNQQLQREVDLGADGLNPESVKIEPANGMIYTVNALDYTDASVSTYNSLNATAAPVSTRFHRPASCSGSLYFLNNIYFQTSGQDYIGVYNTTSKTIWDSLMIGKPLYGVGVDRVNGRIYLSQTDFTTYGKVFIYDFFGKAVDSFAVDVSPGTFAFDVRSAGGVEENSDGAGNLLTYPNPVVNEVQIGLLDPRSTTATAMLTDVFGKEILRQEILANTPQTISLETLPTGVYFLTATTGYGSTTRKIVKH